MSLAPNKQSLVSNCSSIKTNLPLRGGKVQTETATKMKSYQQQAFTAPPQPTHIQQVNNVF